MKHIRSWQERVNEGDSIFAKASALEAEIVELRAYIKELEKPHRYRTPAPYEVPLNPSDWVMEIGGVLVKRAEWEPGAVTAREYFSK